MAAREKMIEYRERTGATYGQLAERLNISQGLLEMIETGDVTHPNIARRIQAYYGLSDEETEELIPANYRTTGADYEPDRFMHPIDRELKMSHEAIEDPYDIYMAELRSGNRT